MMFLFLDFQTFFKISILWRGLVFVVLYIGRCDSKLLTRHIRPSMQRAGLGLSMLVSHELVLNSAPTSECPTAILPLVAQIAC